MTYILFNMSNYLDWEQGIVNRNFYVIQELLKRDDVDELVIVDFFAIRPTNKLFGVKRTGRYLLNSLKRQDSVIAKKKGIRVRKIEHSVWETDKPLYHVSGSGLLHSQQQGLKIVLDLLKSFVDIKKSVLWSYNPFLWQLFDETSACRVFDAVDHWGYHASYRKQANELNNAYRQIDQKADLIFTVSEGLTSLFVSKKALWVPNGIDQERFALSQKPSHQRPLIGYVGTIQERIDFDLIEFVLQQHQDKDFVFAGPVWKGVRHQVERLKKRYPNVSFPGRVHHKDVPQFIASLDVALIPHRIDKFISTTNPMKMYEYLACGIPVVTTPGAGTGEFADVLSIEETAVGFSQAISRELQEDTPQKRQERSEIVEMHGWGARIDSMLQKVKEFAKL